VTAQPAQAVDNWAGNAAQPRLVYRSELDGIRGIAILLVLASHANVPGMQYGGHVGVTAFFVLSGFLITSLLIEERQTSGRVSLRRFYERRARRLLPALVALLVFTGVLAWATGLWAAFPIQALATAFYSGNLAISGGLDMGYLQHTWSLALEEQFYLLWPIVFVLVARRERLVALLVVGIVASASIRSILGTATDATVFRPDVRADAILVGCLLAFVRLRASRLTGWLGVAVLVIALFGPQMSSATVITFATLGAVAIVTSADRLSFLRNRVLVRVGTISYGLYLWHYAIARIIDPTNIFATVLVVDLAFALARVSERWFERPFRQRRRPGSVGVGVARRGLAPHPPDPETVG
jgi:peptidoglycan/LPS O-acetylase OafA/YrhL